MRGLFKHDVGIPELIGGVISAMLMLIYPISFVVAVLMLVSNIIGWFAICVIAVVVALYKQERILARCPHSVPWGKFLNRCQICVREQEELDKQEAQRVATERCERERLQKIDDEAANLLKRERLRLTQSIVPSIEELRQLSPQKFEDVIARMFVRMGFTVKQTPYVNDHGRDAILTKNGKKFLLECKRYGEGNLSGRPDLQKFHSAIITDDAAFGFFVTTGRFTTEASEFAKGVPIKLVEQDALVRMMFDSIPASPNDDTYSSMCRLCGAVVIHRLRSPRSEKCQNRHEVAPTLNVEEVLSVSAQAGAVRRRRVSHGHFKKAAQAERTPISGNTYPVKDQLKALGGQWQPDQKVWMVPEERAAEAEALVASATDSRLVAPKQTHTLAFIEYTGAVWLLCHNGKKYTVTQADGRSPSRYLDVIILRHAPDHKRLAVLVMPNQTKNTLGVPLMEPVVLNVSPASVEDVENLKPDERMYGQTISGQEWAFITRISFDVQKPQLKLVFFPIQALTEKEMPVALRLRNDPATLQIAGAQDIDDHGQLSEGNLFAMINRISGKSYVPFHEPIGPIGNDIEKVVPVTAMSVVKRRGVSVGDRVVIRYLDDDKTATYTLSDKQNDPANKVLATTSPLGKQILGLVEEDETQIEVAGRLRPILIIRIERQARSLH